MEPIWKKAKRSTGNQPAVIPGAADFEEYPSLSAFMAGVPTPDQKSYELSPHTLTMWLEGDMVHFCLQSNAEANKVFGSFPGLSSGLQGVEKALNEERFSVRKAKR